MSSSTMRAAAILAGLTAAAAPAQAEDLRRAVGTYERKGAYEQRVRIGPGKAPGQLRASFEVWTRGCTGEAAMNGVGAGPGRLLFSARMTDHPDGKKVCRIDVTSSDDFRTIKVAHEYCSGFYGAACDFNGSLRRAR